jgi:hypothetical protein
MRATVNQGYVVVSCPQQLTRLKTHQCTATATRGMFGAARWWLAGARLSGQFAAVSTARYPRNTTRRKQRPVKITKMVQLEDHKPDPAIDRLIEDLIRKYEPEEPLPQEATTTTALLVEKVFAFLQGLGLSIEDVGRVIHKRPQVLQLSLREQAYPLVRFLSSELGLTDAEIRRAIRHAPQIFEQNLPRLRKNASFLTRRKRPETPTSHTLDGVESSAIDAKATQLARASPNEFLDIDDSDAHDTTVAPSELETPAFSPRQLARAVAKRPPILWHSPTDLAAMVHLFRNQVGCNARETAHVLSQVPQLLLASPTALASQIAWLGRLLEPVPGEASRGSAEAPAFQRRDLARLVVRFPAALILDTEETMQPRVAYLRDQFRVSDMRQCLLNTPTVLEASLQKDLHAFKSILVDTIGYAADDPALSTFATQVPRFYHTRPQLLFRFLIEEADLEPADARRCMAVVPSLLLLTGRRGQAGPDLGSRLLPHIQFCKQVLGRPLAEVLQAVPEYLGMDLEQHVIPRYAFAKTKLTPIEWQSLQLNHLFGSSTERFCEQVVHVTPTAFRHYVQSGKWLLFYTQIL